MIPFVVSPVEIGALWSDAVVLEDKLCFKSYTSQHAFVYEPEGKQVGVDERGVEL